MVELHTNPASQPRWLVLIGLALALRTLPLPAELKAIAVAGLGVIALFGVAWLLISRVPGITRIL